MFFMFLCPWRKNGKRVIRMAALLLRRRAYGFEKVATPHSKQRGFSRDVINPQRGHILCDRNPVIGDFGLRIQ
jgi:hypothetical protein